MNRICLLFATLAACSIGGPIVGAHASDLGPSYAGGYAPRPIARPLAVAVPPCKDGIVLLLRCAPHVEVPLYPDDVAVLNQVATAPLLRAKPYRQLYSWD
jgi:hypothetical protein